MVNRTVELKVSPIGTIRTGMKLKFDAPHQPDPTDRSTGVIELFPGNGYDGAIRDLEGFSHIWLLWWFHKNSSWRPMVLPPRGNSKRRGVFATRSPHRPNFIGMTAVELIKIKGLQIYVANNDLLDGTPILDIKPYIPSIDSFPDATSGWIEEIEREITDSNPHLVSLSPLASSQLDWLSDQGITFYQRAAELLKLNPSPHRTRRITKINDNQFRMSCGAWRLYYSILADKVEIERVSPGYPPRLLSDSTVENVPDREVQIEFSNRWPERQEDIEDLS